MKKRIIKIGLLVTIFSSGLLLNSCRDALDIVQEGEVTKEVFFSNVTNLNDFLQGSVYNSVDNATAIYYSSLVTDEVKVGASNGGNSMGTYRLTIDASNDFANSIWLSNNSLINNVNRLLDGAKLITPSASEQDRYNKILAEARTMRALAYLQLLTYFSEDMSNDDALGVMLVEEVATASTKLPRSKNSVIYNAINADLDFAEQYLPQAERYYASKNLVNAIRARMNLYRGKYDLAKKYAQEVINSSGLTLTPSGSFNESDINTDSWKTAFYADASNSEYRKIWSDASQGETIFALGRPVTGGSYTSLGSYYNTNESAITGSPKWGMGRNLFNLLNSTDRKGDIRRYAYLDPSSKIDPNYLTSDAPQNSDQLIIDKYPGKETSPLRNDIKLFRLSEMHFILAEVAAQNGEFAEAATQIKKVRDARNYLGIASNINYGNLQDALKGILEERRLELAFEGHRLIDLKRLATKAGVTVDRNITDDTNKTINNLPNGDYRYTLPIPLAEIAGNPNIQQNRNY